jgi:SmpA / OmlA family
MRRTDGQSGRGGRMTAWAAVLALSAALTATSVLAAQEVKSIKPGMTDAEVRATWGEPLTARKAGNMTYLYYNNDCLRTCGTYDVVFLENGQVVDAVVRDSHRGYDGVASSPRERKPEMTVH